MRTVVKIHLLVWLAVVTAGCSSESKLAEEFYFPQGTTTQIKVDIETKYPNSGLYFHLTEALERPSGFRKIVGIELVDGDGGIYRPEEIRDINGKGKLIVAVCDNIPRNTRIRLVKITAYENLQGEKIKWWSGGLK